MNPVRVALAQINPTVGDLRKNESLILDALNEAQKSCCDIIVFPELAVSGYPPEDLLLKQSFLKECKETVERIASKVGNIVALLGAPWKFNWGKHRHEFNRNGEELYNSAMILAHGQIQDAYFKTELPNYGVFDEKRYFSRLETPECLIFVMNGIRFYVTICEDIWIDQSSVRTLAAMNNVDVTLNLSASPFYAGKLVDSRYEALAGYCKRTTSSLVYTNLVGGQDELVFDGTSMILDYRGVVFHIAERFKEDLLVIDLDETFVKQHEDTERYQFRDYYPTTSSIERDFAQRFDPNPIKDRPPVGAGDSDKRLRLTTTFRNLDHENREKRKDGSPEPNEDDIKEVFEALILGTTDYVNKCGFKKVLVGMSGGIDSAVTCALAVEALGPDRVVGITMPSMFTSNETENDALATMSNLEIEASCVPIEPLTRLYHGAIDISILWKEKGEGKGVVWENIQARIRGNLLMIFSNQYDWLVLSTGNKSETAVGYSTLYGDMVGGFAVLKDVYKTVVQELAPYINKVRAERGLLGIPESTLKRPPTAELSPGQTDEKALGPYWLLDQILKLYIEKEMSLSEIKEHLRDVLVGPDYTLGHVDKVVRMVDRNEYKRRQGPPGIKITPRAFGKDRRMPIVNHFNPVS